MTPKLIPILILLIALAVCFANCQTVKPLSTRGQDNMDVPGTGEHVFIIHDKQSTSTLQVTMTLNGTRLSMETTIQYNKYLYIDESSNLMEFRYYKTCITNGLIKPSYTVLTTHVSVVLGDPVDVSTLYNFKLNKKEISTQEKIDLMFEVMNNEITQLKERMWFMDPLVNKIDSRRELKTNSQTLDKFIKRETTTYSGTYSVPDYFTYDLVYMNSYYGYSYQGLVFYSARNSPTTLPGYPIIIQFPTKITFKKIEIEFKNGGTCPYTDTINYGIHAYRVPSIVTGYGSYGSPNLFHNKLEKMSVTTNLTKTADGFNYYVLDIPNSVSGEVLVFYITTNGHTSPTGANFDGKCNFEMRTLKVF